METEILDHESASSAVIRAVSAMNGRTDTPLHSLNDVIDPDALDSLFEARSDDVPRSGGRLSFTYSGCRITLDDGDVLTIEPSDTEAGSSGATDGIDQDEVIRSHRDPQQSASKRTPGSRICSVCQQPIERENLQRERGELVHQNCRPELRCGITLKT